MHRDAGIVLAGDAQSPLAVHDYDVAALHVFTCIAIWDALECLYRVGAHVAGQKWSSVVSKFMVSLLWIHGPMIRACV